MSEKDKSQSTEPEAPQPIDYAFWDVPGASFKVIYSLPVFHEIDFVVNEGYRKIPHGGIEVGGLLFGTIDTESVRIEAFRPIECEHASGPSLNFSDRDLEGIKEQISAAASDDDLKQFQAVGWFLTHTRGPLELTESEATQFSQFFPEPFKLTVLVKPERFQPTRFGFLVRKAQGEMPREATTTAVILPLPGRTHKAGQLIPSLTAPTPSNHAKRPVQPEAPKARRPRVEVADLEDEFVDEPPPPKKKSSERKAEAKKPDEAAPLSSIWKVPPEEELDETEEPVSSLPEVRTPAEQAARRQLSRDRARVIEQAYAPVPPATPFRPPALPSLPANAAMFPPSGYDNHSKVGREYTDSPHVASESVLNPRSVTVLALAALFGCLVGYIAYLQLPAPIISINVHAVNQTILVSWPPDETRNAIYAAIRLNDGPPVPLSADEKKLGQVALTAAKDFKVEILARNWVRDSRGIVRYLHSANGNGQVLPSDSPSGRE